MDQDKGAGVQTYPIPFNMLSRGQKRYLANRGYQMKVPRSRKRIEYEAVVAARDGGNDPLKYELPPGQALPSWGWGS